MLKNFMGRHVLVVTKDYSELFCSDANAFEL